MKKESSTELIMNFNYPRLKRFLLRIIYILLLYRVCIGYSQNTNQEIVTDRPDQSSTPVLLLPRAIQLESGFQMTKDRSQQLGETELVFNNLLVKYGVNEYFELRLSVSYLGTMNPTGKFISSHGLSPLSVGLKIKLTDQKGILPQAALLSEINLKSGSDEFGQKHTSNNLVLSCVHDLNNRLSLTYNLGGSWNGDYPIANLLYTFSLGYSITDKIGIFLESYGTTDESKKLNYNFDGGLTYKVTPNFQLDSSAGIGLSPETRGYFVSLGFSKRFLR